MRGTGMMRAGVPVKAGCIGAAASAAAEALLLFGVAVLAERGSAGREGLVWLSAACGFAGSAAGGFAAGKTAKCTAVGAALLSAGIQLCACLAASALRKTEAEWLLPCGWICIGILLGSAAGGLMARMRKRRRKR